MNKGIMILFFVFILLIAGGVIVYFLYEKPIDSGQKIEYYNVSLRIYDADINKQIVSNYLITLDNADIVYQSGNTTINDFIFIQIPKNRTFTVYNVGNETYYTSKYQSNDLTSNVIRIEMPVYKTGNITITTIGKLGINNPLYIDVQANGSFTGLKICYRWSSKIILVDMPDYKETNIPLRLKNKVDNCFEIGDNLYNSKVTLKVDYNKFGLIDNAEYLNVYVLDGDLRYNSHYQYQVENTEGKDVGAKDILYIIKNI